MVREGRLVYNFAQRCEGKVTDREDTRQILLIYKLSVRISIYTCIVYIHICPMHVCVCVFMSVCHERVYVCLSINSPFPSRAEPVAHVTSAQVKSPGFSTRSPRAPLPPPPLSLPHTLSFVYFSRVFPSCSVRLCHASSVCHALGLSWQFFFFYSDLHVLLLCCCLRRSRFLAILILSITQRHI